MFDNEVIKQIAAQRGLLDIVVEKNYVLDWMLWGISQNEYLKQRIVFKGGTALHKMYFSDWRFSEDLDFTTILQLGKVELEKSIKGICENIKNQSEIDIKQKEINISGDANKEWSTECKIEYIGPRQQKSGNLATILIHITNDEPLIDNPIEKLLIQPSDDLKSNFITLTYSLEEILAEKIRTVFHQRCWPKDIYDTWRLLKEVKEFLDIKKVLSIYNRKSEYKGFKPGIPANFEEQILRIKNQWKEGLLRQINAPPEFDIVYPEIKELLNKLFMDWVILKQGGIKMIESNYTIKYRKGDLEIEVQGDKNFVEEKFKELMEPKTQPNIKEKQVSQTIIAPNEDSKKMSLSEFLKSKTSKSHGDKILLFGYYFEKIMGEHSFNMSDIEKCYLQARVPKTKNFRPYITGLIRNGLIMDMDEKKDNKKAWTLTDTGLNYIEKLGSEEISE